MFVHQLVQIERLLIIKVRLERASFLVNGVKVCVFLQRGREWSGSDLEKPGWKPIWRPIWKLDRGALDEN